MENDEGKILQKLQILNGSYSGGITIEKRHSKNTTRDSYYTS